MGRAPWRRSRTGRSRRWRLAITAVLLVATTLLASNTAAHAAPPRGAPVVLPTFHGDCHASSAPRIGPVVLPVKVVNVAPGGVWIAAGVCIDGQGPFTFLVDTGSSTSLVDVNLARRLHLNDLGGSFTTVAHYQVNNWGVASLPFPSQTVRSNGGIGDVPGLLGSGTLEKFNPIVVNFADAQVLFGAPSKRNH